MNFRPTLSTTVSKEFTRTLIRFSGINKFSISLLFILCLTAVSQCVYAQDDASGANASVQKKLVMTQAVMCEGVKDYAPQNPAVVFSIAIGKVFCFTFFPSVPQNMYISHSWYRRDQLITTKKLSLNTPKWLTFSSIHLREADKGPWRVEIKDNKSKIIKIMRFSITD
ncbi:MAG: DUF2914 domain-containing protein [Desulfobulbaceae bacterium]|nr:DUF2914 domain-containing protein [Desulfobulbaceae bacterium]